MAERSIRDLISDQREQRSIRRRERAFWVHELDAQEQECLEGEDSLMHAMTLTGFDDWPDVIRLAREHDHPGAIELLCRRVERGL